MTQTSKNSGKRVYLSESNRDRIMALKYELNTLKKSEKTMTADDVISYLLNKSKLKLNERRR